MPDLEYDLVDATAHGDHEAFEALVKRYQSPLLNFIYRFLGDRGAAEDLTQEVFFRVYQAAPRFEARAPVSSWIFKIAYNLSINEVKRRSRMASLTQRVASAEMGVVDQTSAGSTVNYELKDEIMSALDRLPENQKAALLLRVNEGLNYREIAEIMQLSVQSVESLIFRARKHLKQTLREIAKG